MKLEIISPEGIVMSKEVDAVSLPGGAGSFTILKDHAAIISTLTKGKIIFSMEGVSNEYAIEQGVVDGKENIVKVYI